MMGTLTLTIPLETQRKVLADTDSISSPCCFRTNPIEQISFSIAGVNVTSVVKRLQDGKLFTRPALLLAASQRLICLSGCINCVD